MNYDYPVTEEVFKHEYDQYHTWSEFMSMLQKAYNKVPEEYRNTIKIEIECETYGYNYDDNEYHRVVFRITYQRPHTKEEIELAERVERERKLMREEEERELFERLKIKYGK